MNIKKIVNALRQEGSDTAKVEAKAGAKGFPESSVESLCAFANTPGGGTLLIGIDEQRDFASIELYDVAECQQTLSNKARTALIPAISIDISTTLFENNQVVVAEVPEADKRIKPVKVKKTGKSYIRQYDGDFTLSSLEVDLFIANRGIHNFDENPVDGTSLSNLDTSLVADFLSRRRVSSNVLKNESDDEILARTGVIKRDGKLTVAGLVALGKYPQEFLTNYSVQASVQKKSNEVKSIRATNPQTFDGPIPTILENVLDWVIENTDIYTTDLPDGNVQNIPQYPSRVIRELIANALIHRDLNPLSLNKPIDLIIKDSSIVIRNTGGLYGIALEELGTSTSTLRNAKLAEICQYVSTANGMNVVERLGTGIPIIREELRKAQLPEAVFIDQGIYFTAIINGTKQMPVDKPSSGLKPKELLIIASLTDSEKTKQELSNSTSLSAAQVRYYLEKLINANLVELVGRASSKYAKYRCIAPFNQSKDI
jgi:ATP-dependent DNA helicase RecG